MILSRTHHNITMEMEPMPPEFSDYFEKIVKQCDLRWSLQDWEPNPNLKLPPRRDIHEAVLKSPSVRSVSEKLIIDGEDPKCIDKQADKLLEEMGHNLNMHSIRFFAFVLPKLLRKLFRGLVINREGIEEVRVALQSCPVVFLPTHRSYIDFLLISYVCYMFRLPMPVVASGSDFKGMALFGKLLQNSGAFFIRRSFGNDKLYWAIVTEYVQYHLKNFQAPVEFFIEAARSRCGKSLPPKQGMLGMVLEPFLKREIHDIGLCPISISFDRTVEENVYAKELLGIPKSKESTKGLYSAIKKMSSENYGRIYVNIGKVLFTRNLLPKRVLPDWTPAMHNFVFTDKEKLIISEISRSVARIQQKGSVVPFFAIVASLLSSVEESTVATVEIVMREFTELFRKMRIPFASKGCLKKDLSDALTVHQGKLLITQDGKIQINYEANEPGEGFEKRAVPRLMLQQYSNQLLAQLAGPAVYFYIKRTVSDIENIKRTYSLFERLFRNEFLLLEPFDESHFQILGSRISQTLKGILCSLLSPYVNSAYLLFCVILQGFQSNASIRNQYKKIAAEYVGKVCGSCCEVLATDQIPRHLDNLVSLKVLTKKTKESAIQYEVNNESLHNVLDDLRPHVDAEMVNFSRLCLNSPKLEAKL